MPGDEPNAFITANMKIHISTPENYLFHTNIDLIVVMLTSHPLPIPSIVVLRVSLYGIRNVTIHLNISRKYISHEYLLLSVIFTCHPFSLLP
jgi:hypothetical protein